MTLKEAYYFSHMLFLYAIDVMFFLFNSLLLPVYVVIHLLPINTSKVALAAPQLELNECKQP